MDLLSCSLIKEWTFVALTQLQWHGTGKTRTEILAGG